MLFFRTPHVLMKMYNFMHRLNIIWVIILKGNSLRFSVRTDDISAACGRLSLSEMYIILWLKCGGGIEFSVKPP